MELIAAIILGFVVGSVMGWMISRGKQQALVTKIEMLQTQADAQTAALQRQLDEWKASAHEQMETQKQEAEKRRQETLQEKEKACREALDAKDAACREMLAGQERRHAEAMEAQQARFEEMMAKGERAGEVGYRRHAEATPERVCGSQPYEFGTDCQSVARNHRQDEAGDEREYIEADIDEQRDEGEHRAHDAPERRCPEECGRTDPGVQAWHQGAGRLGRDGARRAA